MRRDIPRWVWGVDDDDQETDCAEIDLYNWYRDLEYDE